MDNKRLSSIPFDYFEPVKIKKGYNRNVEPEKIYPDDKGMITIEIRELERVEINLNNNRAEVEVKAKVEEDNSDNSNFYSGYLVVGNQLRPLPVGSTLDVERGVFYWQPGPGFIGDYRFVFVGKIQDGEMNLKNINVKIGPR
ncbi:MAG: hypothetical protein GTO45_21540 [Candidatus Aminicenantes bacterium]|nr:hypothetical protein [Candidatus Aminicenantes bacterium]NIM81339.1 hypothetical protein [Candidatus Aminicenantes bacterium]NIN20750.1 hypothetical protein [Candidatus Aminicenantes bacterium]NIN44528.1 hypothetical protein [Candidatus Aminicenantes bacterium]NIN87348.1 hypothetical protein [Candidatus Aminicenantes bacterium]